MQTEKMKIQNFQLKKIDLSKRVSTRCHFLPAFFFTFFGIPFPKSRSFTRCLFSQVFFYVFIIILQRTKTIINRQSNSPTHLCHLFSQGEKASYESPLIKFLNLRRILKRLYSRYTRELTKTFSINRL